MKHVTINTVVLVMTCLLPLTGASCSSPVKKPVAFELSGKGGEQVPLLCTYSEAAASGFLDFSRPERLDYAFDAAWVLPLREENCSLEIEYELSALPSDIERFKQQYELVLEIADKEAWTLPVDTAFLGPLQLAPRYIHYSLPLSAAQLDKFSIYARPAEESSKPTDAAGNGLYIRGLRITARYYGFSWDEDTKVLHVSPFVSGESGAGTSFTIDPPEQFSFYKGTGTDLLLEIPSRHEAGNEPIVLLRAGNLSFEQQENPAVKLQRLYIPEAAFPQSFPVSVQIAPSSPFPTRFEIIQQKNYSFPLEPIPLDPGLIINYPKGGWRDPRFEVFRWEAFPDVLFFDTADYAVQERLFKRLAFFAEKPGFRGKLASDAQIAKLHGWNAHDYRAQTLAEFFELARQEAFPLLAEEQELKEILIANKIVKRGEDAKIEAGTGAVVSISRQSNAYLRTLFTAHEGFHGIFFVDERFRDFSRTRYEGLSPETLRFIRNYLEYDSYDISDGYLVINEFMSYVMQQPASLAYEYFGRTAAGRIDSSTRRRSILPPKDAASNSWPSIGTAFGREAAAFSAYAKERWNLSAGQVWHVTVTR
ncbi:hypothetical protein ACYULU_14525 [Breznakiellaceae bacterium SP9]